MCDLEQKEIEIEKIEGYIPALQRDARAETIKINKSKYSVPSYGEVELTVSASVLLSDTARITFVNENNNRIDAELFNVGNNTYKGDIKINQYANIGKYKLATIRLYRQDNKEPYYYVYTNDLGDKYDQNAKTGDLELDLEFEVYANNTPDVITGTQAENLLESIKNAKDDAIIYVDATNDSIIKKEVFEAIKGTNKELHIESSGIEWIFKGKDIINPKQIDTSISVLFDYNYNKTNMKDYIDKSVVILFKDNGELPGISTIRIKLDYVFRSYIGNKIYVYYTREGNISTSKLTFDKMYSLFTSRYRIYQYLCYGKIRRYNTALWSCFRLALNNRDILFAIFFVLSIPLYRFNPVKEKKKAYSMFLIDNK